ncbi:phospholipid-transporting ATPase ABCA1-like [Vanessa atalanta]|uniref:phospholipid-transporting ATPase ABCA1-like n=1 Tax=Vanessa atalanta TaxID=42275 RepID=UPI001FCD43B1|nr:phospholipid-transporting ATPase ABCA1-like [Vanessa atalanta]
MKGTLKVLMWKHLVVRARRFIHTPIEILSPTILFITLFCVKNSLLDISSSHEEDFNVYQTQSVYLNSVAGPDSIFYTPQTDLTSLLMNKVGESLMYQEKYTNVMKKPKITPAPNPEELLKFSREIDESVALVIFQNMSGTWPEKLKYTIRMKNSFNTYTFRSSYILGHHEYYGTIYEPFMKLQWAIDSNYLELLTGNKITQRVTLREFPYVTSKENNMAKTMCAILMTLCSISLILVFVFLVARLLEERITGIQELIKMVGVSDGLLGLSHALNAAPAGLAYGAVPAALVTASSLPILPDTNPLLVFLVLALHYVTVLGLAFSASYIINSTQYTESLAVVSYVLLYLPCLMLQNRDVPTWILPLCGLLPHVPLQWFWNEVAALQQYGVGLTFANIATTHSPKSGSVLACYLCMVVQAFLYFGLAWYLAKVKPGPFGQSQPWNFMCQKQYWSKKKVMPEEEEEELEEFDEVNNEPQYFEPQPKDMEVGIKIVNVSKMFGKQRALSDVTLDVYRGEITVLLGHNGAGKTTLMSIITGMLKATEGEVYVEGLDTYKQRDEMQRILGLCPQHNLFFPDLTVMEHVMFFTLLKGTNYAEAKKSSTALLEQLGIANKSSCKSSQLSGGMKRRLQLACALAGDAKVLVLDEPTSGLDVETRRELWDLLLSLRGSRTVLLSTHFMEEAEALGDRVAALHAGRLRCHATTMHLKRALGTGYRLTFTTIGLPNEPAITATITSKIPEATVKETSLNSISYNLPSKCSDKFPKLFSLLESKRSSLGIDSIGVGISTLEEVFLKLCSDVTTSFSDDTVDGQNEEPTFKTMTGARLYFHQMAALLKRQVMYLWSKKLSFLTIQVLIPIALICCVTIFTNNGFAMDDSSREDPSISLDLNLYNDMADRRVLYNVNATGVNLQSVGKKNPKVDFEKASDVASAVVRIGQKDILEYNNYLVGIELNDTDAEILFTTVVRHAAPVALNLLTNTIATQLLPYADGQTVTTLNHPVSSAPTHTLIQDGETKYRFATMLWAFCVVLVVQATVINAASLACGERASGARRVLALSGAAPARLWGATLLAHALLYALVLVLPTLLAAAALDRDRTIDRPDFLGAMAVILFLGIISFLALIYIVSFNFEEHGANIVHVAMVFMFGFFTPSVKTVTDTFGHDKDLADYVLSALSYALPPHTLTACALRAAHVAAHAPALAAANATETLCYFCFNENAPGELMLVMLLQFVVYMSIVILTEYGVFNMMFDRLLNSKYQVSSPVDVDEMVRAEKAYVEKAITLPKNQIQDAMLVNEVHKKYWRLFGKSCNAVKGVSFSVKKGECFGLLGVNGAGKSSTFKMMTGTECPTRGSIFANGHFMTPFSTKYLQSLGYCPQFAGLDDFLTGYENLKLLLTLRGLEPADVEMEAKTWIEIVGLEKHAHRRVAGYSGGCSRRLSAAAALCAGGAATLLDEPTAGVDVAARRRVWAAVRRARRARALVVCSHSMDEMEALCGRLAILSAGRVRALGGAAALRAAHAAGHAVQLKLAARAGRGDETDSSKSELHRLKAALQQRFNCTLRDEHRTMLHYHINDTLRYSELFTELENLRENFSLLEDYSVTETTLEEVFLSFAKEEAKDEPTPV